MLNVKISNEDLTEASLSSFEPRDKALVEAAVFLIAAKEVLAPFEPFYGELLSLQAHRMLEPLRARKQKEAEASAEKVKEEVESITGDIRQFIVKHKGG